MISPHRKNPESTWFGDRPVDADSKAGLVRDVFDSVAEKYDLMNDLMSGGVHRVWKDRLIRMIRPRPDLDYLDVAGGTGDIAFRLHKAAGGRARITVCDINPAMLEVGRARALNRGLLSGLSWVEGNAERLPFTDNSQDVYTIAFGLRNVTRIDTALADAYRVLRPGGRFYCLEFSRVEDPALAKAYAAWSRHVIPRLGGMVAQDRGSYQYLVESIRRFPPQAELARRMEEAGFSAVNFTNLSFGIAAIHAGLKA